MLQRILAFARTLSLRGKHDGITDASASLAFWTFLSLFPALIGFVAVLGSMELIIGEAKAQEVRDDVTAKLDRWLAGGELETVRKVVNDILTSPSGGLALVGFLGVLWAVSKGFAGLSRELAKIHRCPERRWGVNGRLIGLGLGLATLVLATVGAMMFVLGPFFGALVDLSSAPGTVWLVIRGPLLAAGALAWLTVVLKVAPGVDRPLRSFLPGALTAVGLLVLLVAAVGFVVGLGLLSANPIYGALGGVILAMTFLNLGARAVLTGGEINALRFEAHDARAAAALGATSPADTVEPARPGTLGPVGTGSADPTDPLGTSTLISGSMATSDGTSAADEGGGVASARGGRWWRGRRPAV